jgi:hypothetical protein
MIPCTGTVVYAEIVDDYEVRITDISGHSFFIDCEDEDCSDWRAAARDQLPAHRVRFDADCQLEDERE